MVTSATPRSRNLSKEGLVHAAIELMESAGETGFSLRKLGERVGCDPMAVLYHFKSKEGLLRAMADQLTARVRAVDETLSWQDRLYDLAAQYRQLALEHPHTFRQMQRFLNTGSADYRVIEMVYRALRDAGLSEQDTPAASVGWYAVMYGLILGEIGGLIRPATPAEIGELDQQADDGLPLLRQILPHFLDLDAESVFKMMMRVVHQGLADLNA
ncbi:TetR/AcrR family transcriptional regulator [Alcaligenes sp. SDU_A2]|uniref:TetR/AcrR family transcriptional regulator n=1 Tax=Alcaligenes sp. SDU_A2 TaxID=3136634 RepID=UPI002B6BC46B|nr:TetR/AcrR family transcriptional regulator C-terminal domain-containing protein [Alcaligenes sp.]HRL27694.1 TetR/AcrR family transcriptional regulator C-terminal domain-containing protein [Alcaligenes sp.]